MDGLAGGFLPSVSAGIGFQKGGLRSRARLRFYITRSRLADPRTTRLIAASIPHQ